MAGLPDRKAAAILQRAGDALLETHVWQREVIFDLRHLAKTHSSNEVRELARDALSHLDDDAQALIRSLKDLLALWV